MTLRLYIVSGTPNSVAAVENLRRALDAVAPDCPVDVVDAVKKPDLALSDGVLVTPTLIRLGGTGSAARMIGRLEPADRLRQFLTADSGDTGASAARKAPDSSERR